MPVTREYFCNTDGVFFVKRPISAPLAEKCPKCQADANRSYLSGSMPTWGVLGNGIPDDSKDLVQYEQWQRDRWVRMEDKCNVANMGTGYVDPTKIVEKHRFGKDD